MVESTYLIYKHTSPSGKSYIGQTNNLDRRNKRHRQTNECRAFYSAIQKYGWESFTTEILAEHLTLEEANKLEERFIYEHATLAPCGYNLLPGGLNRRHSEESKQKMSVAKIGKPIAPGTLQNLLRLAALRIGTHLSEATREKLRYRKTQEHKDKISVANKGKVCSEKQKLSISEANKGRQAHNKGKSPSDESRVKMSIAQTGKKLSDETKQKISDAHKHRKILICPYCHKQGHSNMYRFHFDNCKQREI